MESRNFFSKVFSKNEAHGRLICCSLPFQNYAVGIMFIHRLRSVDRLFMCGCTVAMDPNKEA